MTRNRRTTLALMALAAACATLGTSSAQAQGDYPAKPLRFIVPYPAGGAPTPSPA